MVILFLISLKCTDKDTHTQTNAATVTRVTLFHRDRQILYRGNRIFGEECANSCEWEALTRVPTVTLTGIEASKFGTSVVVMPFSGSTTCCIESYKLLRKPLLLY